jgi:hypothetical protein
MPHYLDRAECDRAVAAQLRDGEVAGPAIAAILPNPDPGTAYGVSSAFPLLWLLRGVARWRARRSVQVSTGFPTAPRMVLALSGERLLVWSASRRWRLGEFLGDVPLGTITAARAPTVGQGWRSVVIELAGSPTVTVKVGARQADDLAAGLTGARR